MEKVKLAKRVKKGESYKLERSWNFTKIYWILYKIQGIGTHVLCDQCDYPTQSGHFPHNFCNLLSPRSASYRTIWLKMTMYFSRSFFHFLQQLDRFGLHLTRWCVAHMTMHIGPSDTRWLTPMHVQFPRVSWYFFWEGITGFLSCIW
jgi:hypothetical protein